MAATVQASSPVSIDRSAREPGPHNLPQPLTTLIGRQHEIAEARRILGVTRLLTLTGTGGVGKTRLGHEIAASLIDAFEDGVWLVELAALADPSLVPQAVASVLGLRGEPTQSLTATLRAALRPKRLLLVLDNCEHQVDACAELVDALLIACPQLRIMATSRQPLGIVGETVLRVPSLSLSPRPDGPSPRASESCDRRASARGWPAPLGRREPPMTSEAAHLFAERARTVAPGFGLTECNAPAVERICQRLDGIPLAIELAAARVTVLGVEQIADRLGDRLRLLTGGNRTTLPRHRTLRALIDWSHDLLDEGERVLFRRLAVFSDGWTLEAAEAVCAGDPPAGIEQAIAPDEILDLLSGLVTKSLVLVDEYDDTVRYRMLETLREHAAEKLREAGEESPVHERHRDWYLAFAERAEPALVGSRQAAWLDCIDRDRENVRAITRRAVVQGETETLVRLMAALWRFWHERTDAAEARELIAAIAPSARQLAPSPALARALHGAAMLAGMLTEYATCRALLADGLAVARQLDDRRTLATLLDALGRQLFVETRYAEARPVLDEGVAIFREIDDRHGLARALSHLGFLEYLEGHQESACAIYREGLDLARAAGDPSEIAEFLDNLGRTYQAAGDLDGAASTFVETGQKTTLEKAVDEARSWLTGPGALTDLIGWPLHVVPAPLAEAPGRPVITPTVSSGPGLSARELEVAALVARGLTNRKIADELVITEGTAASHVKHILAKLALDSRVQIVAWAIDHGLYGGVGGSTP